MAHILVVDDDAPIRELITDILEAAGHTVESEADGAAGLEAVEQRSPDLIVLDLAMPGVDGWRFLDELHRRDLRRTTRVLIVSGEYDPTIVLADHRSTPGSFLAKPFDPDDLVRMVGDLLAFEATDLYDRRARPDTLARLVEKVDRTIP